jgi:AcrR family transcriptional regulator
MAADASGLLSEDPAASTRDRIKAVAARLYVLRGHDGFSFADIARAIGTTRANIHHHFGSKRRLIEELIEDFAADAEARTERYWTEGDAGFFKRLELQLDDLRRFYESFNKAGGSRNVWSPLSRLRHDLPELGPVAEQALERVNRKYEAILHQAVRAAIRSGELAADTPTEDLVRILRGTLLACPPMTQDKGGFDEIAQLFSALARTIGAAWKAPAARRSKAPRND